MKLKVLNNTIIILGIISSLYLFLAKSSAATFSLVPNTTTFEVGCSRNIIISVDATGESSNAADIIITFDPAEIDILDSDTDTPGTQILTGNAYTSYFYNSVDEGIGEIRLAAASYTNFLTAEKVFGTIQFQGKPGTASADFTIDFDGAGDTFTYDSNIADSATNLDLLTGVTNGSYSFIVGPCATDVTPPSIFFNNPTNGQADFPVTDNLVVRLTDDSSGIDLNEVQFVINGIIFTPSSPEVSYTGTTFDYTFVINPDFDLSADEASSIVVLVKDQSGNENSSQNIFNIPENTATTTIITTTPKDQSPPTVLFVNPKNLELGVPEDSIIEIDVVDDLTDIDLDTIKIYINGELYIVADDEVEVIQNTTKDYTFKITPRQLLDTELYTVIQINGQDKLGNQFDRQMIFNLPDAGQTGLTTEQCEELVQERLIEETQMCEESITQGNDIIRTEKFIEFINTGSPAILAFAALPLLLTLFSIPGAIFQVIGVFLGKSNNKPWGIIKDIVTGKPITFAVCNVYSEGANHKIAQVITDLEGRYGFSLNPGSYRLEVKKNGYKDFTTTINIPEQSDSYIYDVEMSPSGNDSLSQVSKGVVLKNFAIKKFSQIADVLFIVGFIFSLFALYVSPNVINIIIVGIYAFITAIKSLPNIRNGRKYASVISQKTNLRVPFAQVKIFEPEKMRLIDTKTTNQDGYFDYYGEPGKYAIQVVARGFNFPSKESTLSGIRPSDTLPLVDLKRGGNKINLYVDRKDNNEEISTSPFS